MCYVNEYIPIYDAKELPHYRNYGQRGRYLASDQNSPIFLEENYPVVRRADASLGQSNNLDS